MANFSHEIKDHCKSYRYLLLLVKCGCSRRLPRPLNLNESPTLKDQTKRAYAPGTGSERV